MTTDHLPADPAERVALAFNGIRTAHAVLAMFPYAEAARDMQRQADMAWYTNPSLMLGKGNQEDIERKIRLLQAAATFVAACNDIIKEPAP